MSELLKGFHHCSWPSIISAGSCAAVKYLFSQIKSDLNSSRLLSVHQHSDLVHTHFHPSSGLYFHWVSSHHFPWVSAQHILYSTATITDIFYHHIQSYSITSHCWPCEAGYHVPLHASWNVTYVPHGCIIPRRIRHVAAGTDTSLFEIISQSLSSFQHIPHSLTCSREVLPPYCAALKPWQVCYLVITFNMFLRDETHMKKGRHTHNKLLLYGLLGINSDSVGVVLYCIFLVIECVNAYVHKERHKHSHISSKALSCGTSRTCVIKDDLTLLGGSVYKCACVQQNE